MKTRKTNEAAATPQAKGKVKLKNLKLTKETIETLSDQDAATVKGGARTQECNYSTIQP